MTVAGPKPLRTEFTIHHRQCGFFNIWTLTSGANLGPKKYRKIARMYDRTGSEHEMYPYKNRPFPTFRPEFRPFVDALG